MLLVGTVDVGIGDALRAVLQCEAGAAHRVVAAEADAQPAIGRSQDNRVAGARVGAHVHRRRVRAACARRFASHNYAHRRVTDSYANMWSRAHGTVLCKCCDERRTPVVRERPAKARDEAAGWALDGERVVGARVVRLDVQPRDVQREHAVGGQLDGPAAVRVVRVLLVVARVLDRAVERTQRRAAFYTNNSVRY